ncbi:hypothetical protein QO002_003052 [Pararhizobium capsulatum DSM 1112]|uniref:Uncharacterized protein n=1 Tax=Pararhizobium capsulatum DSM 1112 TaxID=1121113 RepID=A0ABU0BRN9_9HYPH|nr:hypothetical protein [Pararhizobium capsulatum]MDQ0320914.1 hypothetical protein [Pararhizobium capsulatum DSM 1112]
MARHSVVVSIFGTALVAGGVAILGVALFGWATQGAEIVRALGSAGMSWCL